MKKPLRIFTTAMLFLALVVSLWFVLSNIITSATTIYLLILALIGSMVLLLKTAKISLWTRLKNILHKILSYRYFITITIVTTVLLGLSLRLFFYFQYSYAPISDPATFYGASQNLIEEGNFGDLSEEIAFFPYLAAYSNVLALANIIIPDFWLAAIIANTLLSLGTAICLYFVAKTLLGQKKQKYAILAFVLWFLSPFEILFSTQSLPVTATNFFIGLSILLFIKLFNAIKDKNAKKSCLLAAALGLFAGLGNCFRPIFSVIIIAIIIYAIYFLLKTHGEKSSKYFKKLSGASVLIILAIFCAVNSFNLLWVSKATGTRAAINSGGWSVFVGSNQESRGQWNLGDTETKDTICAGLGSEGDSEEWADECHSRLTKEGVKRYLSYGFWGTISLGLEKLETFSSWQNNIYNASGCIVGYGNSKVESFYKGFIFFYVVIVITLCIRNLYFFLKNFGDTDNARCDDRIIILVLLLLGFFFSSALVEVANRYAQVMYPVFVVLASLSLGISKKVHSRSAKTRNRNSKSQ